MTKQLHRLKINYRKDREQKLGEKMQAQKAIIFFDGLCHLCNGFVDFTLSRDFKKNFQFAPLQGETAKLLLTAEERTRLDTVILIYQGKKYYRSEAILKVLIDFGGIYRLWTGAYLIPFAIRQVLYNWIAKNRYAWFGQRDSCRLPTADEKDSLLP